MKYLLLVPAILLAVAVALYVWATNVQTHTFDGWEEMYD